MICTVLSYLIPIAVVLCTLFIGYFIWVFNYWKRLGIPYRQPIIPYGNTKPVIIQEKTHAQAVGDVYKEYKSKGHMHAGYFFLYRPVYVPIDLDLIKTIMQVDFHHFMDHGTYHNEKDDPLSAHLFSIEGQKWRNLRIKLTPTFTSGKMKMMLPIMVDISERLIEAVREGGELEKIEAKQLAVRFTTDIIGCCAFGIDCNSLEDPNTEFCVQGKRIFTLTNVELMRTFFCFLFPKLGRAWGFRMFPKVSTDFFWKIIEDNANYRQKNNIRKNDFFQLLLDLKNEAKEGEKLTFRELAAQAFLFFVAGYETSSLTLSFTLYELARNDHVQNKLRDEIITVLGRHNGKLTYEALSEMTYMDMVTKETLRKYPPVPLLTRVCTEQYKVPNTKLTLQKGLNVFIPIETIHYDPEHYPNPDEFDPERFTEENAGKRHHFAYLPFGEGPRTCIGLRFGVMQTKVGLAALIKNYRVKVNAETRPIKMSPRHFLNMPANPIWLDFERI